MMSFWAKWRHNDVKMTSKLISVKIVQMGWNFDTNSKIRQKRKKLPKISIWRHCDVILDNFCKKINVIFLQQT